MHQKRGKGRKKRALRGGGKKIIIYGNKKIYDTEKATKNPGLHRRRTQGARRTRLSTRRIAFSSRKKNLENSQKRTTLGRSTCITPIKKKGDNSRGGGKKQRVVRGEEEPPLLQEKKTLMMEPVWGAIQKGKVCYLHEGGEGVFEGKKKREERVSQGVSLSGNGRGGLLWKRGEDHKKRKKKKETR